MSTLRKTIALLVLGHAIIYFGFATAYAESEIIEPPSKPECEKFLSGCGGDEITNNATFIDETARSQAIAASLVEYRPSAVGKTRIDGGFASHKDLSAFGVTATHALTESVLIGGGAAKAEGSSDWLWRVNAGFEF